MKPKPIPAKGKGSTLSTRQRVFVEHYLSNGFNGHRAALAAGYSPKTAQAIATENLRKPIIEREIARAMEKLAMPATEAMGRLAAQARGDIREFIGLTPEEVRAHPQGHLIKRMKMVTSPNGETRVEIEMYDAQSALTSIIKEMHLQAGEATERSENVQIELSDDERARRVAALLDSARARRAGPPAEGDDVE